MKVKSESKVTQLCPTLSYPMDCRLLHLWELVTELGSGELALGLRENHRTLEGLYSLLLEKAMAPHFRTLAWKIPWTEEPGRLQSMRSLRVGHD